MHDSLYGNLLAEAGPAPNPLKAPGAVYPLAESALPDRLRPAGPKGDGDDIFADPPLAAQDSAVVSGPMLPGAGTAAGGGAVGSNTAPVGTSGAPSTAPLGQNFSAARLMMPPVRKRAEPVAGKKPMMPSLDLQKLQEEKEALMRQRAAAADKPSAPTVGATSDFSQPAMGGVGDDAHPGLSGSRSVPPYASAAPAAAMMQAATGGPIASAASLYGSPDEEYDPAKPNDYDEFCRRRMRQKAEEEMEKRRQELIARQQAATKAQEVPKEDDFATKMMKKMGWKEGTGLGKEAQGVVNPLVMKKTDRATGTIVEGGKREAPAGQPSQPATKQAKAAPPIRAPTRVLLLNNLVGKGEVDEDLEEETGDEARRYGKLRKCVIKEAKELPDDQAVRIFLEYERIEDATKALVDMNGRYFGGRVVKARFYDEARFAAGDLDRKEGE